MRFNYIDEASRQVHNYNGSTLEFSSKTKELISHLTDVRTQIDEEINRLKGLDKALEKMAEVHPKAIPTARSQAPSSLSTISERLKRDNPDFDEEFEAELKKGLGDVIGA